MAEAGGLRAGEVEYVNLEPGTDDRYAFAFAGASLEPPADGTFLRGRLVHAVEPPRVVFGIEAFFAPKVWALKPEDERRDGGVAVLMVSDGGRRMTRDECPST